MTGYLSRLAALFREDPLTRLRREQAALRSSHREARHAPKRAFLKRYVLPGGVGVEIGVFWAHFSEVLLEDFQPRLLHLVDPWDRLHGETFRFKSAYSLQGELRTDVTEQAARDLEARAGGRVKVHKLYTWEFFDAQPDASLDWAYIDGSHTHEAVLRDLRAALPKLKPEGILFGDDYFPEADPAHHGVRRAVDEFAAEQGLELVCEAHYQYVLLRGASPRPDPSDKGSEPHAP